MKTLTTTPTTIGETPDQMRPVLGKRGNITFNNPMPVQPSRTINPGLFIAIVDSLILGVWLAFNPDMAIYAGYALTLVPLACIAVVMSGKARRLLR